MTLREVPKKAGRFSPARPAAAVISPCGQGPMPLDIFPFSVYPYTVWIMDGLSLSRPPEICPVLVCVGRDIINR